jgi:uncharacterized membrane protein YfcA
VTDLPLLLIGGGAAGAFGALLGLGGGILIVPLLTLGFGLELREAVGVSLVCVIVTSSATASVYLQRDQANLRLGMTLEMFTAAAALGGGLVAFLLPDRVLAIMFAALLLFVAATMTRGRAAQSDDGVSEPDGVSAERPDGVDLAEALSGPGYRIHSLGPGIAGSLFAGIVSALFGVGGGIVKVPVMHLIMGVPLRVATATSNLMIGVTASAGGLIYLFRGGIDPYVAAPTAVGVFVGASLAARLAHRVDLRVLRLLFGVMLVFTALQMALRASQ